MRRTRGSEVLLRCSSQNGTFCFGSTGRPARHARFKLVHVRHLRALLPQCVDQRLQMRAIEAPPSG